MFKGSLADGRHGDPGLTHRVWGAAMSVTCSVLVWAFQDRRSGSEPTPDAHRTSDPPQLSWRVVTEDDGAEVHQEEHEGSNRGRAAGAREKAARVRGRAAAQRQRSARRGGQADDERERVADERDRIADEREFQADAREKELDRRERTDDLRQGRIDELARRIGEFVPERMEELLQESPERRAFLQ
jgi:hypothetical protein